MSNSDLFTVQGSKHKINQDYAASVTDCIAISDGCSMAADSDFGSRLLTRNAVRTQHTYENIQDLVFSATVLAVEQAEKLFLNSQECLSATLLIARQNNNKKEAVIAGDGLIFYKTKDSLRAINKRFISGAPYYPIYPVLEVQNDYANHFGTKALYTYYVLSNDKWCFDKDELIEEDLKTFFSIELPEDTEYVGLSTDGIDSFIELENLQTGIVAKTITTDKLLERITKFPSFKGEFLNRRCSMAFKEFNKINWKNTDDFTCGVLNYGS